MLPDIKFGVTDNLLNIGLNSINIAKFTSKISRFDSRIDISCIMRYKNIRTILNSPKETG